MTEVTTALNNIKTNPLIAVIGLGYVGLPLAVEFSKHFRVVGFDVNKSRIAALNQGNDETHELTTQELSAAKNITFTDTEQQLAEADVYIVTVPTPIDAAKRPDLAPLIKASELVGRVIGKGNIVVYESTVYPGATEEDCIPVVERVSGLIYNQDFYAGYSPERINPGDKEHCLATIKKVTSGSTPEIAEYVDALYRKIITAGTHKAPSIKVAEAAKVIENTQRDINIAIVNEFAQIFNAMGIDTMDVLEAAGTKWNFLPFKPGLVGGHCIGVDPYYLSHKSQNAGYVPDILIAGRRINDGMGRYVADQVMGLMVKKRIHINGAKVLVLGIAFKENCPDIRNSRVIDIVRCFEEVGAAVDVYDPCVNRGEVEQQYGLTTINKPGFDEYDAIVLAVAHDAFKAMGVGQIRALGKNSNVLYDIKCILPKDAVDGRL